MKAVIWLGIVVLTQISDVSSSKKSLISSHISTFWAVLYFCGDFGSIFGNKSFSQRISRIYGNRKF